MINTLKSLITGLTDWLSGLKRTKNTSGAGSLDSAGSGSTKTNGGLDWTTIVLFVIFGVVMYLIPSPFQLNHTSSTVIPVEVNVPGKPDTVRIFYPVVSGKDSAHYTQKITIPQMAELVTDKEDPNAHVYIRTSVYPTIQNDTLHLQMWHEYNIQPRGFEIHTVDTIKVPYPVEAQVSFFEKPAVVATSTVAATLGIVYIISRILK